LSKLDIKNDRANIGTIRPGRVDHENRLLAQPFLICDANTGFAGLRRYVDNHPDHATRIIASRRTHAQTGLYISRSLHDDEHLAQVVFLDWKYDGIIRNFIISVHSHYMLYFQDESFVRVRIPLNLIRLSNPSMERIKAACEPNSFVYGGEICQIPERRTTSRTQNMPTAAQGNGPGTHNTTTSTSQNINRTSQRQNHAGRAQQNNFTHSSQVTGQTIINTLTQIGRRQPPNQNTGQHTQYNRTQTAVRRPNSNIQTNQTANRYGSGDIRQNDYEGWNGVQDDDQELY